MPKQTALATDLSQNADLTDDSRFSTMAPQIGLNPMPKLCGDGFEGIDHGDPQNLIGSLERYDLSVRECFNRIFLHNGGTTFEFNQNEYHLKFLPRQIEYKPEIVVDLSADDTSFRIGLERCFLIDLPAADNIKDLPEDIRGLYLEVLLEDICQRLEVWSGTGLYIDNFYTTDDFLIRDFPYRLDFQIQRTSDKRISQGHLCIDFDGLQMLSELADSMPAGQPHDWNSIPVGISIEIGQTSMPLHDFKQTKVQDIILADNYYLHADNGFCKLRLAKDWCLNATWENNTLKLLTTKEGMMSDKETIEDFIDNDEQVDESPDATDDQWSDFSEAPLPNLDELPIELTFDIGFQRLTLGELKHLQTGRIFKTDRPENMPVRIRANGQIVGRGDLVRLSDSVGVRVVELFDHA